MKEFNELFEKATEVADRRKKVFNQLIEKTKKEILPNYCKLMGDLGYEKFFIDMKIPIFPDMEEKEAPDMDTGYPISINSDGTFSIYDYDYDGRKGIIFTEIETIESPEFLKTGILSFLREINERLDSVIEKMDNKNNEAEKIILMKEAGN
jgi:hypothetical protein